MQQETPIAPEQTANRLRKTAEALFRDPKLIEVCRHAYRDRGLRAKLLNDPTELLRSREMNIPSEFTIEFFEPPCRGSPDLRLGAIHSRAYHLPHRIGERCDNGVTQKCTLRNETLCCGFRLYPESRATWAS